MIDKTSIVFENILTSTITNSTIIIALIIYEYLGIMIELCLNFIESKITNNILNNMSMVFSPFYLLQNILETCVIENYNDKKISLCIFSTHIYLVANLIPM